MSDDKKEEKIGIANYGEFYMVVSDEIDRRWYLKDCRDFTEWQRNRFFGTSFKEKKEAQKLVDKYLLQADPVVDWVKR